MPKTQVICDQTALCTILVLINPQLMIFNEAFSVIYTVGIMPVFMGKSKIQYYHYPVVNLRYFNPG